MKLGKRPAASLSSSSNEKNVEVRSAKASKFYEDDIADSDGFEDEKDHSDIDNDMPMGLIYEAAQLRRAAQGSIHARVQQIISTADSTGSEYSNNDEDSVSSEEDQIISERRMKHLKKGIQLYIFH